MVGEGRTTTDPSLPHPTDKDLSAGTPYAQDDCSCGGRRELVPHGGGGDETCDGRGFVTPALVAMELRRRWGTLIWGFGAWLFWR
jgi:hypothetical protein